MSNRDALSGASPKTKEVPVGDGKAVLIRALSGAGRTKYGELFQAAKDRGGLTPAEVAAMALCEPDGKPSFDIQKPEDIAFLEEKDGAVLEKIALEFYELSGLSSRSVEDEVKN